tara:strand:+ start:1376 stop:1579 length:204 start_codon:yes stop_codon:yes gene_type:complete
MMMVVAFDIYDFYKKREMTNTEILSYLDIPHGYPRKRTDIFGRSTEDCPEGICISILNDHLNNLVDK